MQGGDAMKWRIVLYAVVGIAIQVAIGQWIGKGQGSLGLLIFIFLIELDPRTKCKYILPNIKQRHTEHRKGDPV
jgi:hypothetical protein